MLKRSPPRHHTAPTSNPLRSIPTPPVAQQPSNVQTPQPSQSRLGSGEKSAFRTVERPSQSVQSNQPCQQKPSLFRAISQLLASDNEPSRSERRIDVDDDDDEEIQVQDSPGSGNWRERWSDQQPLELTKHDR